MSMQANIRMQDYTLDNGELYISADRKSHTYL